jgi:hypothetical protein
MASGSRTAQPMQPMSAQMLAQEHLKAYWRTTPGCVVVVAHTRGDLAEGHRRFCQTSRTVGEEGCRRQWQRRCGGEDDAAVRTCCAVADGGGPRRNVDQLEGQDILLVEEWCC